MGVGGGNCFVGSWSLSCSCSCLLGVGEVGVGWGAFPTQLFRQLLLMALFSLASTSGAFLFAIWPVGLRLRASRLWQLALDVDAAELLSW